MRPRSAFLLPHPLVLGDEITCLGPWRPQHCIALIEKFLCAMYQSSTISPNGVHEKAVLFLRARIHWAVGFGAEQHGSGGCEGTARGPVI